jgi:lipopolysaccharide biosynthesis protein
MASDTVSQAVVTAVGDALVWPCSSSSSKDLQKLNNSRDGFLTHGYRQNSHMIHKRNSCSIHDRTFRRSQGKWDKGMIQSGHLCILARAMIFTANHHMVTNLLVHRLCCLAVLLSAAAVCCHGMFNDYLSEARESARLDRVEKKSGEQNGRTRREAE